MKTVAEHQIVDIEKTPLSSIQSEVANSDLFSLGWLNEQSDELLLSNIMPNSVRFAKFTWLKDSAVNHPKLVLFGALSWDSLCQFQCLLKAMHLDIKSCRLVKPLESLTGAIHFYLSESLSAECKLQVITWAESRGLECCYLDNAPSVDKPGLLVMDMDSTAIEIECIDEIAKLAGVGDEVAKVTAAAMRGELDFAESLRARVKTLTGAPVSVIDEVADNLPLMPGLENLVKHLQSYGWKIVIASGGFTYMTDVLKSKLNLDRTVANQLEVEGGTLTGRVLGDIVDALVKADTVKTLAQEYDIPLSQTIAMGDGANDLIMMDAANLGVAFHAKPLVRQKADVSVRAGGLDQLLYLI